MNVDSFLQKYLVPGTTIYKALVFEATFSFYMLNSFFSSSLELMNGHKQYFLIGVKWPTGFKYDVLFIGPIISSVHLTKP